MKLRPYHNCITVYDFLEFDNSGDDHVLRQANFVMRHYRLVVGNDGRLANYFIVPSEGKPKLQNTFTDVQNVDEIVTRFVKDPKFTVKYATFPLNDE